MKRTASRLLQPTGRHLATRTLGENMTSSVAPPPPTVGDDPDRTLRSLTPAARRARTDQLWAEVQACVGANRTQTLYEEIIELNIDVAEAVASRYRNRGTDGEDLSQIACLGLAKAVHRFDPGAGFAFLSYAVPTIRGEIQRHFRDHGWAVRPPRAIQELQADIRRALDPLTQSLGRAPRPTEIAAHLEADLEHVIEAMAADGCFTPASLDVPVTDDGSSTVGDRLVSERDPELSVVEARILLEPALAQLTPRQLEIIRLRFFDGLTQREVGERIGVTQMQVSRLLSRILSDLRTHVGDLDKAPVAREAAPARGGSAGAGASHVR